MGHHPPCIEILNAFIDGCVDGPSLALLEISPEELLVSENIVGVRSCHSSLLYVMLMGWFVSCRWKWVSRWLGCRVQHLDFLASGGGCIAPSNPTVTSWPSIHERWCWNGEKSRPHITHLVFYIIKILPLWKVNFSTVVQNRPPFGPSAFISVMLGGGVLTPSARNLCFSLLFVRLGKAFAPKIKIKNK